MKSLLIMIFSVNLMACGAATETNDVIVKETAEEAPDFSNWSRIEDAQDSCVSAELGEKFYCQTEFMAGKDNCPLATFKFITVKAGYMYVQTKEGVFIRQGEFHQINFTETPDVYNVVDSLTDKYYSVFDCKGQEG